MSAAKNTKVIDDTILAPIALNRLDIESLRTHNSDALDFHDVSVWGVRHALRDAYRAGLAASAPIAETLRILMTSCEEALSGAWDKSDSGFEDMIELASRALANWEGGAALSRPRFEDLACPRCGQTGGFHVDVTAVAYLDANGPCVEGDYYWDDTSECVCVQCQKEGRVADFVKPTEVSS